MSLQPSPENRPGVRISDADRESAAARLHQALTEGRITLSELEERLSVVYAALYEVELRPPLADLPGAEVTAAAAPSVPAGAAVVLRSGMGPVRRTGMWTVPPRLRVQSVLGSVVLDFCDTTLPHAVIDIELTLGAGSAKLLVPDESTADLDGLAAAMGEIKSSVPSIRRAGIPHFVVHGRCGMGSVRVRRRYRFAGHRF
ncbi:MAG: DUF1707 SHOCT-like domain-containing protein [Pseudonocardia sp.]